MTLSRDALTHGFIALFLGSALVLAAATPSRADRDDHRRGVVVVKTLPRGFHTLHLAHGDYFEHRGRFYQRHTGGFALVPAPLGALVVNLPLGNVRVNSGGAIYFRLGETYYRPARGGYRVVAAPIAVAPPAPHHRRERVVVERHWLKVHAGPGTRYPVLVRVRGGTVLSITARRGNWLKVRLDEGGHGWILSTRAAVRSAG